VKAIAAVPTLLVAFLLVVPAYAQAGAGSAEPTGAGVLPGCQMVPRGSITPPDETLDPHVRALSGAWEGTYGFSYFWLIVGGVSATSADVFYGAVDTQRPFVASAIATIAEDGRLGWLRHVPVGRYELTLSSDNQQLTGFAALPGGLERPVALTRCTPQ